MIEYRVYSYDVMDKIWDKIYWANSIDKITCAKRHFCYNKGKFRRFFRVENGNDILSANPFFLVILGYTLL